MINLQDKTPKAGCCKHQTLVFYGQLPKFTTNLYIPIPPGRWKMALRRITYNGIYVGGIGGIATRIRAIVECNALSSSAKNYNGTQKHFLEVFQLKSLKTSGDENINFEPPVLVLKSLIPDQSFDHIYINHYFRYLDF